MRKRILVCEDHEIVYTGLKLIFEQPSPYELLGLVKTGRELVPAIKQLNPDILILDLNLPDTDGFTLLKSIREFNKDIHILILTIYQDELLVERASQEGANGYLLKNVANEELLQALASLNSTSFYVLQELKSELARKKIFRDTFSQKMKLTRREIEIIRALANGRSSEEVSTELFISPHTVDTHRKNIFRKLEVNNLAALVRFAYDHKII